MFPYTAAQVRAAVLVGALAALLLPALGGCLQSTTLGNQPPDVVQVGSPPTWQNGVQQLMALKCAVCHTVPRPASAPDNVPTDLDLTQLNLNGTILGAQDVALAIQAGILQQAVFPAPQMPLPFATPLVASERTALETWAAGEEPPALTGATTDGIEQYAYYCQICHGVHGQGAPSLGVPEIQGLTVAQLASAIMNIQQMQAWPGLAALTTAPQTQLTDIAAYLQSP